MQENSRKICCFYPFMRSIFFSVFLVNLSLDAKSGFRDNYFYVSALPFSYGALVIKPRKDFLTKAGINPEKIFIESKLYISDSKKEILKGNTELGVYNLELKQLYDNAGTAFSLGAEYRIYCSLLDNEGKKIRDLVAKNVLEVRILEANISGQRAKLLEVRGFSYEPLHLSSSKFPTTGQIVKTLVVVGAITATWLAGKAINRKRLELQGKLLEKVQPVLDIKEHLPEYVALDGQIKASVREVKQMRGENQDLEKQKLKLENQITQLGEGQDQKVQEIRAKVDGLREKQAQLTIDIQDRLTRKAENERNLKNLSVRYPGIEFGAALAESKDLPGAFNDTLSSLKNAADQAAQSAKSATQLIQKGHEFADALSAPINPELEAVTRGLEENQEQLAVLKKEEKEKEKKHERITQENKAIDKELRVNLIAQNKQQSEEERELLTYEYGEKLKMLKENQEALKRVDEERQEALQTIGAKQGEYDQLKEKRTQLIERDPSLEWSAALINARQLPESANKALKNTGQAVEEVRTLVEQGREFVGKLNTPEKKK